MTIDYNFLRQEGIRHIERLGSQQWTDYNTHDPGITILEQLCYALTDLLYRIGFPMSDLLSEGGQDPFANLVGLAEILTSSPVTLTDWHKLLLDMPDIWNAWIEHSAHDQPAVYFHKEENTLSLSQEDQVEPLRLQGIQQIYYQGATTTKRRLCKRLYTCRGLAEDFSLTMLMIVRFAFELAWK
ncbi:MAG: hypothetical protein HC877_09440 [Thioploca sp.]|nr:hypothetical protein [Thioploca sp.]